MVTKATRIYIPLQSSNLTVDLKAVNYFEKKYKLGPTNIRSKNSQDPKKFKDLKPNFIWVADLALIFKGSYPILSYPPEIIFLQHR